MSSIQNWRQLGGFLLLSFLWGSTWVAIRVSVQHMPVLRSVALRFSISTVILLMVVAWKRPRMPNRREWGLLALFSVFTGVMPFSLVAWASNRTSSGMTSILFACSPLLVAGMERWWVKGYKSHRFAPAVVMGLAGGVIGIAVVLFGAFQRSSLQLKGVLVVLFVVVFGAFASIQAKQRLSEIPPLTVTTVTGLIAAVILSISSFVLDHNEPSNWDTSAVLSILYLSVCSSAIGSFLFYWLLMNTRPYQLASRYFLMPIVALTEGRYLMGELVTTTMIGGIAIILVSLVPVLGAVRATASIASTKDRD